MVGVDQVLEKLATVVDPDLKKDIVSMGMIKDLELNSGDLKFTLALPPPAWPFNDEIEADVRKAIDDIDGIENFDMKVTAKVMDCLLYTSPSPRDRTRSRMPSSA